MTSTTLSTSGAQIDAYNDSPFFKYLSGQNSQPTVASLAQTFVTSKLGLVIAGSGVSTWTAYGADITMNIYKDQQQSQIVWDFEFTIENLTSYTKTPGHAATNPQELAPIVASGTLSATIPLE